MIDTDEEQRKCLVSAIERIVPLSDEVRHAFLSVSRRIFVPTYYRREGGVLDWTLVETADAAYTDEALVTKIDPISKHPSSSSSQPSLMAMKLAALDLHPGQRVLEVGAGTGYNAALIASIVGATGWVVSIDIDDDLVEKAVQHLAIAGVENVQVVCGDGLLGYAEAAPYDRLLATGSFRALPDVWLDQLAPGGKLVGNLIGNLASVFVCLTKNTQSADGILLPIGGNKQYMELHHGAFPHRVIPDWSEYETAVLKEYVVDIDVPALIQQTDFLFLLQCLFPQVQRHWRYNLESQMVDVYFLADMACLTVQAQESGKWIVRERGGASLWDSFYEACVLWEQHDHPSLDQYRIYADFQGQYVSLNDSNLSWVVS